MEKKIFINDQYANRVMKANNALLKAYDSLDFTDPDWDQKIERLSKLHKEISQDIQNANNAELEAERLRIEDEKNKTDSENKLTEMSLEEDRIRLDEARDEATAENNRITHIMDGLKIAAMVSVSAISGAVGIWKFKKSTQKEEDGAYLTTTDKETVREGLRDQSSKNMFKFW